jgi:hypothetical protein
MTNEEMEAAVSAVREWVLHPQGETADYRLLKLKMLMRDGFVRLVDAVSEFAELHPGQKPKV